MRNPPKKSATLERKREILECEPSLVDNPLPATAAQTEAERIRLAEVKARRETAKDLEESKRRREASALRRREESAKLFEGNIRSRETEERKNNPPKDNKRTTPDDPPKDGKKRTKHENPSFPRKTSQDTRRVSISSGSSSDSSSVHKRKEVITPPLPQPKEPKLDKKKSSRRGDRTKDVKANPKKI